MCGIVGILGREPVAEQLVDSLKRLEYRGYNSAGVATLEGKHLERRRAEGKLKNLEKRLEAEPLKGTTGIGHTRWATHGKPTVNNAHPHATDRVAVVHNGIIENFRELREELEKKGTVFHTQTDTEIVLHLVDDLLTRGNKPVEAVKLTLARLRGAFALGFIFAGDDDLMIGARNGPPLAIGYGDGEMYLGSDAIALGPFTDTISYLEDGDWVVLTHKSADDFRQGRPRRPARQDQARRLDLAGRQGATTATSWRRRSTSSRKWSATRWRAMSTWRPSASRCRSSCRSTSRTSSASTSRPAAPRATPASSQNTGSSVLRACRSRSMSPPNSATAKRRCARAISRSSSRNPARPPTPWPRCATPRPRARTRIAVVNVPTSTIARESETVLQTLAGPEIGVASTKAFTCQLMVLANLAIAAGKARGELSDEDETKLVHGLVEIPRLMSDALTTELQIEKLAHRIAKSRDVLYLGRGTSYPLALEGALKLKEISYIHAEGYAAGELKHGPIALIDETMPVVVIAPYDRVFEKTVSNMQEVAARGGNIILMTDAKGAAEATVESLVTIVMPDMAAAFTPMVYAVPVQLLAYHTAVVMGTDVDQPRNLAKSVTVE